MIKQEAIEILKKLNNLWKKLHTEQNELFTDTYYDVGESPSRR